MTEGPPPIPAKPRRQRPNMSGPLCQNCLATELYCQACREMDREPCCSACEHVSLEPSPPAP